ncbi:MAG: hypothetical protein ACREJ6_05970 [Candidatus Methylomirabilis sp.]
MKDEDHVELVIDGKWFKGFSWSRLLIDPESGLSVGAAAIPIHGKLLDLRHPHGVVVSTDGTWDGKGQEHPGLEALIPWGQVIGILKIEGGAESASKSIGFSPKRKR